MPWYAWILVAAIAASSGLSVVMIGKPRTPSTPGSTLAVLVINGLLIWAIVSLGLRA